MNSTPSTLTTADAREQDPPVTVVVSRKVKSGREADFEAFVLDLSEVALSFEGHLGANIFRPTLPDDNEYRIIFKFDHRSNYLRWFHSPEREKLMTRSCEYLQEPSKLEVIDGLETWFSSPEQPVPAHPPRYKMAVVTWLALFPIVTGIFWLFGGWLALLPLVPRTLTVTVAVVILMSWVVMPRMTRWFRPWLYKGL